MNKNIVSIKTLSDKGKVKVNKVGHSHHDQVGSVITYLGESGINAIADVKFDDGTIFRFTRYDLQEIF